MSAYVEAQMAQYHDRAYTTHGNFTRSLLAEVAHEQKARRRRQRPLLARLWAARPHIRGVGHRPGVSVGETSQ